MPEGWRFSSFGRVAQWSLRGSGAGSLHEAPFAETHHPYTGTRSRLRAAGDLGLRDERPGQLRVGRRAGPLDALLVQDVVLPSFPPPSFPVIPASAGMTGFIEDDGERRAFAEPAPA